MKKLILFFSLLIVADLTAINAQDTWTQKADFGGTARTYAVAFSIESKGYIGTGGDYGDYNRDFWEFNPATDSWTQKADFGGTARIQAAGFSIGSKGYIGTGGNSDGLQKDFWEYDPDANTWTQKAEFGGTARESAVGFSVGGRGYIGTGYDGSFEGPVKDFWEYDPTADTWTQKAEFAGVARFRAVGFSIADKGYIGTGADWYLAYYDFWQYDPIFDTWTRKEDVPLEIGRAQLAVGFSIGNKGYITTGTDYAAEYFNTDLVEYNPDLNTWAEKALFPGTPRYGAVGFSIGNKGYVGTGYGLYTGQLSDFWEYAPEAASICTIPTGLNVIDVTAASAKLNWDAVVGAHGYLVRYKVQGTDAWTKKTTTTNAKKLTNLSPNTTYAWEVKTYCSSNGSASTSEWSAKQFFTTSPLKLADELSISLNVYPNPFESSTNISFSVAEDSRVQISVYDVAGKLMQTVLNENISAGDHTITLDRNQLIAGIYLLEFQVSDELIVKKVVIE